MLRFMLLLSLVLSLGHAERNYLKELHNLDHDQYKVLIDSLSYGKSYDLGYTLAAIAWKESHFGKYKVNQSDGEYGSYGVYHILLDTALRRENIKDTGYINRHTLKLKLITDNSVNAAHALTELNYWKKYHKGSYKKMVASYNAGWKSTKSNYGYRYYKDISKRVKVLKSYLPSKVMNILLH